MPPPPRSIKNPAPVSRWSALAGATLAWSMVRSYLPSPHRLLRSYAAGRHAQGVDEHGGGSRMKGGGGGDLHEHVKALPAESAPGAGAGGGRDDSDRVVPSMGDGEEVTDESRGSTVFWRPVLASAVLRHRGSSSSSYGSDIVAAAADRGPFHFHRHLLRFCREGRAIMDAGGERKHFTNAGGGSIWRQHVVLKQEHPSTTFDTLAMDPARKREIMADLDAFRKGSEFFTFTLSGRSRQYLLHGPPGTGKSSMIAAMANHLDDYDVYYMELTSVGTDTDLRKLFWETTSKSIIVIEDIDCSLDLTRTMHKEKKKNDGGGDGDKKDAGKKEEEEKEDTTSKSIVVIEDSDCSLDLTRTMRKKKKKKKKKKKTTAQQGGKSTSAVTLSGLLNVIRDPWSVCGGERLIVLTTKNHVDKLDPALVCWVKRHIEMSYCCFEAFKVLARNYLAVDAHHLFDEIQALLQEVDITPADVAELLTPKRAAGGDGEGVESCLTGLVEALQQKKASTGGASGSVVVVQGKEGMQSGADQV